MIVLAAVWSRLCHDLGIGYTPCEAVWFAIAAAYAERPAIALEIARDILLPQSARKRFTMRGISSFARVAKYSAIHTLRRIGSRSALDLLAEYLRNTSSDPALKHLAQTALHPKATRNVPEAVLATLSAANRETRSAALDELARAGAIETLPQVRRLAATDCRPVGSSAR